MRHSVILLATLLCSGGTALAQVTVDLRALDSLPIGSSKLARPGPIMPEPRRVSRTIPTPPTAPTAPAAQSQSAAPTPPTAQSQSTASSQSTAPTPPATPPRHEAATAQPQPALPADTPATVALAPIPPPLPSATPPPPPPVSATAATEAKAEQGGLRVTFAAAQIELSPDSVDAIKQLAGASADGNFNVLAYAAGSPEDPSAARRLSLSRALAVRSALLADGVASSRIFVRALGAQPGEGPADRVDVGLVAGNATASTPR